MEKYVYSGSLTQKMHDLLLDIPGFEPLDILISQLDRSAITKTIQWKHEGFCRWLFIDSGAFSIHTGNAHVTCDEYIEYLNSIDDDIDVCAQLDTIPGHLGKDKTPEDYVESAKGSWENFLYMRSKLKSPEKVMPVFHQGENFTALQNMLEWKDENGKHLDYIGISPANDLNVKIRTIWINECNDIIKRSSNPNVKTHLYGYTSLDGLAEVQCYSADSISHRLISGYAKLLVPEFGVVSVSKKTRTVKTKSNMSFQETADEYNMKKFLDYIHSLGFTLEQVEEDSNVRVAITMMSIQKILKANEAKAKPTKSRKLFNF